MAKSHVWLTSDRRELKISEMTTNHLNNCIAFIQRHPGFREEMLPILQKEIAKRMSANAATLDISFDDDYPDPIKKEEPENPLDYYFTERD